MYIFTWEFQGGHHGASCSIAPVSSHLHSSAPCENQTPWRSSTSGRRAASWHGSKPLAAMMHTASLARSMASSSNSSSGLRRTRSDTSVFGSRSRSVMRQRAMWASGMARASGLSISRAAAPSGEQARRLAMISTLSMQADMSSSLSHPEPAAARPTSELSGTSPRRFCNPAASRPAASSKPPSTGDPSVREAAVFHSQLR
mmetsp:Transcript_11385/g.32335  ORF Transcript_11385/g.32335 Transcript_11385/m.32335 type:complete len:201 (+) Transcript_11385:407-1009(+)